MQIPRPKSITMNWQAKKRRTLLGMGTALRAGFSQQHQQLSRVIRAPSHRRKRSETRHAETAELKPAIALFTGEGIEPRTRAFPPAVRSDPHHNSCRCKDFPAEIKLISPCN